MPNRMPQTSGSNGPDHPLRAESTDETLPASRSRLRCEPDDNAMLCERCGKGEMYRMHAVWRCPKCGFKTDCCGW